jgi:hypothetical protein
MAVVTFPGSNQPRLRTNKSTSLCGPIVPRTADPNRMIFCGWAVAAGCRRAAVREWRLLLVKLYLFSALVPSLG